CDLYRSKAGTCDVFNTINSYTSNGLSPLVLITIVTRAIVKKVTALEYRVLRCQISKEDYLAYIQYEINLLSLLKKRRKATGYNYKKEIEYASVTRIHALFKRAEAKWKDDLQLWLSHIKFCKLWKCKMQLSKLYASVLAIHPNKIGKVFV
uniref:U3 small nucleolar RNA-associated protein 6 N-terminal domain-containing protein n=1 Tax=Eptatretus burgeri TaxID=7764 RepID=A0A8C4MZW4_EPTBU